jgi:hypothetical protein
MISSDYLNHKTLKEGHFYPFNYVKCVKLEDNNLYMILEDHYGIRHFIEHEHYKNYSLSLNSIVNCLVAKINCTGRIYLEPEHPIYKVGEEYHFEVASLIQTEEGVLISVYDCYGNILSFKTETERSEISKDQIPARVVDIKKGIPELADPEKVSEC